MHRLLGTLQSARLCVRVSVGVSPLWKSFHPNDLLIHSSFSVTSALQCESDNATQKQVKIVTNDSKGRQKGALWAARNKRGDDDDDDGGRCGGGATEVYLETTCT